MVAADAALLQLLRLLKQADYRFTAVTPATHQRVLIRRHEKTTLRDIFGWSRCFAEHELPWDMLECLEQSGTLERAGNKLHSRVRVASLGDDLFLHSAFPTDTSDAVFFGPDTYRFVRFVRERIGSLNLAPRSIADIGTGSGAGAIAAAHLLPNANVSALDINAQALRLAAINAEAAGVQIDAVLGSGLPAGTDLVIANPPYIMDDRKRAYRDGGDLLGGQVALDWTEQALEALRTGGTMLLYTGAAVMNGQAPLVSALQQACAGVAQIDVEESDPDVFGEELDQPAYAEVERIGVICATIRKT